MNSEANPIDITNDPGLRRLVEEVRRTKQPRPLQRNGRTVAFLTPVAVYRKKGVPRSAHGTPTSVDDPLWHIVGIATSDGPTDVSSNTHKYLAGAYAAKAT